MKIWIQGLRENAPLKNILERAAPEEMTEIIKDPYPSLP